MKKNVYLFIIGLVFSGIINAQRIRGIAGFIQSGYMNAPNAAKAFYQVYPDNPSGFANNYFLIGVEGFYRQSNNVFMADLQFGVQKVYSFNDEHAGAVYEAMLGKYGRIITEEKNFWLYPSIGTGISVISLTGYTTTDGIRENMRTQTLATPVFDIAMNSDFLLSKLRWKENYYLGWILGLKAGYRISVKSNNWSNTENNFYKVHEMPSYANNSFYLTLSFGGGSFDTK